MGRNSILDDFGAANLPFDPSFTQSVNGQLHFSKSSSVIRVTNQRLRQGDLPKLSMITITHCCGCTSLLFNEQYQIQSAVLSEREGYFNLAVARGKTMHSLG